MNNTPRSERTTIAFFGRRNAGKSSLLNKVTGQEISVVSDVKGTTTDPVSKAMELLPLGPVTLIDTPGFDDEGALGEKRVKKTREIIEKTDIAVLVTDTASGIKSFEEELLKLFRERNVPTVIVYNKADLTGFKNPSSENEIYVSALTGENIENFKNLLASFAPVQKTIRLVGDFIKKGDKVILVCPIDSSAPKARLILPQQQAIRDILDTGASALVLQPEELKDAILSFKTPPALVICDSQVFKRVAEVVPKEIPLTSFSILFARYKGLLDAALKGAKELDNLPDGANVLIAEGCTHHRQCGDIGTVKLPAWIKGYTKKDINFEFTSGGSFPENLERATGILSM